MARDEYQNLILDTRMFLSDLADNNNRDWFVAHKDTYDDRLKMPALVLLDQVATDLEKLTGTAPTTKLFRPNRDVRFTKDKSPYHLHLHMQWSTPPTGWSFGIGQKYISVGAGVMWFDKDALVTWRNAVSASFGAQVTEEVDALLAQGARIDSPELKRVPAPYNKTHTHSDLLRRKSLCVWFDFDEDTASKTPLSDLVSATFEKLAPLNALLAKMGV